MSLKGIVNGQTNRSLSNLKILSEEKEKIAQERLSICKQCPILNQVTLKCDSNKGGCGCNMKTKVYCTFCKCPKGKW